MENGDITVGGIGSPNESLSSHIKRTVVYGFYVHNVFLHVCNFWETFIDLSTNVHRKETIPSKKFSAVCQTHLIASRDPTAKQPRENFFSSPSRPSRVILYIRRGTNPIELLYRFPFNDTSEDLSQLFFTCTFLKYFSFGVFTVLLYSLFSQYILE